MYLKTINLLTNIPISCLVENLNDAREKKKKKAKSFNSWNVVYSWKFCLLILLKAILRADYSTYVFVFSVVKESPDFPGPCIDSMAVE